MDALQVDVAIIGGGAAWFREAELRAFAAQLQSWPLVASGSEG